MDVDTAFDVFSAEAGLEEVRLDEAFPSGPDGETLGNSHGIRLPCGAAGRFSGETVGEIVGDPFSK